MDVPSSAPACFPFSTSAARNPQGGRKKTERAGFEPAVPKGHTGFRNQLDQPLRHLSVSKRRPARAAGTGPAALAVFIVPRFCPSSSAKSTRRAGGCDYVLWRIGLAGGKTSVPRLRCAAGRKSCGDARPTKSPRRASVPARLTEPSAARKISRTRAGVSAQILGHCASGSGKRPACRWRWHPGRTIGKLRRLRLPLPPDCPNIFTHTRRRPRSMR
jgi:hypothetical protein